MVVFAGGVTAGVYPYISLYVTILLWLFDIKPYFLFAIASQRVNFRTTYIFCHVGVFPNQPSAGCSYKNTFAGKAMVQIHVIPPLKSQLIKSTL